MFKKENNKLKTTDITHEYEVRLNPIIEAVPVIFTYTEPENLYHYMLNHYDTVLDEITAEFNIFYSEIMSEYYNR